MPPKTYSIEALRALGDKEAKAQLNRHRREVAKSKRFDVFAELVRWLQRHWDEQTIVVPLPMNHNNEFTQMHWRDQHRVHQEYNRQCADLRDLKLMPTPPQPTPELVTIEATFYLRKLMDADGLKSRIKHPLDFLNRAGWMADDNTKHLRWAHEPQQFLCGKTPPRIEITIKGVE
jgi:hypothetical protein